ncbi:MAG TPA: hypothetical protein VF230_14940 [Acidimicrobiales bacterium]
MIRRALACVAVLAAVAVVATVSAETTRAAFSDETTNVSTFSAASSFGGGPCSPYTHNWMTGMEHQYDTTAGGGIWSDGVSSGAAVVDTAVKRSGAASIKLSPNSSPVYRGRLYNGFGYPTIVMSFAMRFDTLPAADVYELAGVTTVAATANYVSLRYIAATNQFSVGFPAEDVLSNINVEAGKWYTVDLKVDVGTTTHRIDWRLNGVAQTGTTRTDATTSLYGAGIGTGVSGIFTANYDDIVFSTTAADYPIGNVRILALQPDGLGTSSGAGSFVDDDATAIDATSALRLADVPAGSGTTHIRQTAVGATSYVEVTMDDTTESCVRGAHGMVVYDPLNTNQGNHGKTVAVDGTTESVVHDGAMRANNTFMNPKSAPLTAAGGAWTPAALNGLRFRIGYSTDANPQPRWHSLVVEYDAG